MEDFIAKRIQISQLGRGRLNHNENKTQLLLSFIEVFSYPKWKLGIARKQLYKDPITITCLNSYTFQSIHVSNYKNYLSKSSIIKVVRSHIGWGREGNNLYKGVKTSP